MDDTSNAEVAVEATEATTDTTVDTTVDTSAVATASWLDGLDVSYRNDPNINKFDSAEALAKSYTEVTKMIGKDKVVLPSGEGEEYDAQMNELYSKLGRPETAEGYGLENIDLTDQGVDAVLETGEYAAIAHKLGLTPDQAKGVLDFYVGDVTGKQAQQTEAANDAVNEAKVGLRKEYGAKYEENMQAATRIFDANFPSLKGSELARDPGFVRDLVKLSKNFGETKLGDSPVSGTKTPAEAKAEMSTLMSSPEYQDPLHPLHDAAVDRFMALIEMGM